VRGILVSLSSLLTEAQARGLVAQNVVRMRGRQRRKGNGRAKLKIGVDIPSLDEIKQLIPHLAGPRRALIITAIFTGLRASELRGLRWTDVDLKKGELHVRQRADPWGTIGAPKSAAGTRTVPIPPQLVSILRECKLACPNGPGHRRRQAEVHRPARTPTRLRLVVYQPQGRRRSRIAAQGRAGSPRSQLDRHDRRRLRAPVRAR
jgi:integrase